MGENHQRTWSKSWTMHSNCAKFWNWPWRSSAFVSDYKINTFLFAASLHDWDSNRFKILFTSWIWNTNSVHFVASALRNMDKWIELDIEAFQPNSSGILKEIICGIRKRNLLRKRSLWEMNNVEANQRKGNIDQLLRVRCS